MAADPDRLRILQLHTYDTGGGSSQVARRLFDAYRALGHASYLAVGRKKTSDPDVILIGPPAAEPEPMRHAISTVMVNMKGRVPGTGTLYYWMRSIAQGRPGIERAMGWEDFNFPLSRRMLDVAPEAPDIVHAHNLHGRYFDLRYLPELSHRVPLVLTLHDAWLLSGHCAHSFDCDRWQTGCGHCPDLGIYPGIPRDATAHNWRRKQRIYRDSRLYVAAPSDWLMQKVKVSMLAPGCVECRVIPNGVDLNAFHPPAGRAAARAELGLPLDARIVLFAAQGIRNSMWRDYPTTVAAAEELAARLPGQQVLLLALGEAAPGERAGAAEVRYVPWQQDPFVVARYYQAADVYLHSAKADTFPGAVVEALACGTPVVATAVGGIPEQIRHGETGFLTPPGDAGALARFCAELMENPERSQTMGESAARDAAARFDLKGQVNAYLDWYREILAAQPGSARAGRAG